MLHLNNTKLEKMFENDRQVYTYGTSLQLVAKALAIINKHGGNKEGISHLLKGLDILSHELKMISGIVGNKMIVDDLLKNLGKKKSTF